jgi:transcription antitermination factor NusG
MAYSGYELKVKAAIEERIALAGLEDQFGEILSLLNQSWN